MNTTSPTPAQHRVRGRWGFTITSILITVLSEVAAIERTNIRYRLESGRQKYIADGGKLGRKQGSIKSMEQRKEEYKEVISLLRRNYSVRNVAKLTGHSLQTIQTVKNQFINNQTL